MARRKNTYIFAPDPVRRKNSGCLALLFAIAAAAVLLIFLSNEALNRKVLLVTEKIPVMSLDKAYEGFSVLHISDLHGEDVGTDEATWRSLLHGKRFDAVVLTGDMVGKAGNYAPLVSLIHSLRTIKAEIPIYFVAGDSDPPAIVSTYRGTSEVYADWITAAQRAGATYLDVPTSQQTGKSLVWFVPEYLYNIDVAGSAASLLHQKEDMEARGVQYEAEGGASYRALLARLDAMQRAAEAVKGITAKDLQIAVTHVPLEVEYVRNALEWATSDSIFSVRQIQLVLAGHYTGGQWRFLGLGPVYVPDRGWFPGDPGIVGFQRINSINQYITAGLGASPFYAMPGRLFNAPSAALLSFTARIQ